MEAGLLHDPDDVTLSVDEMHFRECRGFADSLRTSQVYLTAKAKSVKIT